MIFDLNDNDLWIIVVPYVGKQQGFSWRRGDH